MALTKAANRMITGSEYNVFDYIPEAQHAAITAGTSTYGASTDIQAAIDDAAANGGGVVKFPAGTYIIDTTLVTESLIYLVGAGMYATTLQAQNSLNAAVVQSKNYATLVGTNKWKTVDNVQYNMGFFEFTIDGNKANQTSGNGIEIYGKQLTGDNVFVRNCKDIGWVSEAGDVGGQDDWTDVPEGSLGALWARDCDSHGFRIRGPHDQRIGSIVSVGNGGWGVRVERVASTYAGQCEIQFTHIYSNTSGGLYADDNFTAEHLIVENNFGVGLSLNEWGAKIFYLEAFDNCKTTGTFQVEINTDTQRTHINSGVIRSPGVTTVGGLLVNSPRGHINNLEIRGLGATSTGVGLRLTNNADFNSMSGIHVRDFAGAGGIGFDNNNGGAAVANSITGMVIENCTTCWQNNSGGNYNFYDVFIDANSGQTFFAGSGPKATDTEQWHVRGVDNVTNVMSERTLVIAGNVDLNTLGVQSWTLTHNMGALATPDEQDCQVSLSYSGANTTFRTSAPWIGAITSSQITIKIAKTVVAGAAETGKLVVRIKL